MSEGVFAFRRSTAQTSEADIRSVMGQILSTLDAIKSDVANLEPHWIATEADTYYSAARKLNKGSVGVAEILQQVEAALGGVRTGTDNLRQNIWSVLEGWN